MRPIKMSFQTRFPKGKTIGVNAIPMADKKVMTQGAHPNVKSPKIKDKKGIELPPRGSVLVRDNWI